MLDIRLLPNAIDTLSDFAYSLNAKLSFFFFNVFYQFLRDSFLLISFFTYKNSPTPQQN